jgi:hypothetical protein
MSMDEYFTAIHVRDPVQKRIQELLAKIKLICPDTDFIDVTINDYIEKDGSRKLQSIRFYSEKITVKVNNFTEDNYNFVIAHGQKSIDQVKIETKDYDFVRANDNSRLSIVAKFSIGTYTDLKGSGNNCDYLFDIYKKYIQPRIKPQ